MQLNSFLANLAQRPAALQQLRLQRVRPAADAGTARPGTADSATAPSASKSLLRASDQVTISDAARAAAAQSRPGTGEAAQAKAASSEELSPEEKSRVRELQKRDREVRAHEQAHKAAAGSLATGGPNFEYETGPDSRRYAVGGEVQISTSGGSSPQEALRNAERVQRAAAAPEQPSAQDQAVAARAAQSAREARAELEAEEVDEAEASEEAGEVDGRGESAEAERAETRVRKGAKSDARPAPRRSLNVVA